MNVELELGGTKKTIEIKNPLVKHQREYLNIISAIQNDQSKVFDYLDFRERVIRELCPDLAGVDFSTIPIEEADKIMSKIEEKFSLIKERGFTTISKGPQS